MADFPSDIGDFVIGSSPIGGPAQSSPLPSAWPPTGPTTILNTIPAYLYVEYQDDQNVQSFIDANNEYVQAYIDYLNNLNLPIYTNGNIVGSFLDWVATGIYGYPRPSLPSSGTILVGPINTWPPNEIPINGIIASVGGTFYQTTDDIYKRCLTWHFYKGDGMTTTAHWLKRRINRFLNGVNGADVPNDTTYNISVAPTGFKTWTITLANSPISSIFKIAVQAGVLELPFQIQWTVTLV